MAKGVNIRIEGLDKLTRKISQLPAKLRKEIGAEIGFAAENIAAFAKTDAPADQGLLRNEISTKKINELNYEVVSQADYSAYLEFGTRTKVQIPAGLESVASEARNRAGASSLSAKEAIFEWCKRKGIEPSAWYPIYLSIMIKGITPHPFFFKQAERVRPKLIKNVQNILDNP